MTAFNLLKLFGRPGSISLLAVLCAMGFIFAVLFRRKPVYVAAWFVAVAAGYTILALPVTALRLERLVAGSRLDSHRSPPHRIDTLVVLDGDNRRGRLADALRLWALTAPKRVIVSGEPWIRDRLLDHGLPHERVQLESEAATTREQIEWLRSLAAQDGQQAMVVVASCVQAPRVAALVERSGVSATVWPSPLDVEPPREGARQLVPSYAALRLSRDSFYEYWAIWYYQRRGWIETRGMTG